jgi:hypothetical protein
MTDTTDPKTGQTKHRIERWAFSEEELEHPDECKSDDELTAPLIIPDSEGYLGPDEFPTLGIFNRCGKLIDPDIYTDQERAIADGTESFGHPEDDNGDVINETDHWYNVYVNEDGSFKGWAPDPGRPDVWIVKIDERDVWPDEYQAKTKRIYGVYALDKNRHVNCCEMTPSYEMYFIENQVEYIDVLDEEEEEALRDEIQEASLQQEGEVTYSHVHEIDPILNQPCKTGFLPDNPNGGAYRAHLDGEPIKPTWEEAFEEVIEYAHQNGV